MVYGYLSTNVALIGFMVSEKTRFTDDGWMDGHLRLGISAADTVKQS